jgi:hypothetical protein
MQCVSDRGDRGLLEGWTCTFWEKLLFPFPFVTAKLWGDFFGIKECGANNDAMTHRSSLRQWRCRPNSQREKWTRGYFSCLGCVTFYVPKVGAEINWCVISMKIFLNLITYCQSNLELLILLEGAETEIHLKKCFKKWTSTATVPG